MLKKLYNHLFCQPHMARRIPVLRTAESTWRIYPPPRGRALI